MGAQENKQSAREAYAAFAKGDAEGAMRDIDDSIEWTVRGDNALTGVYRGKGEVAGLWGRFLEQAPETEVHELIAEGDKVVVITTDRAGGEEVTGADVLTYNDDGKLIAFDTLADETVTNRLYPK